MPKQSNQKIDHELCNWSNFPSLFWQGHVLQDTLSIDRNHFLMRQLRHSITTLEAFLKKFDRESPYDPLLALDFDKVHRIMDKTGGNGLIVTLNRIISVLSRDIWLLFLSIKSILQQILTPKTLHDTSPPQIQCRTAGTISWRDSSHSQSSLSISLTSSDVSYSASKRNDWMTSFLTAIWRYLDVRCDWHIMNPTRLPGQSSLDPGLAKCTVQRTGTTYSQFSPYGYAWTWI